jgi:nitrite reductase/ring-hydroxylating ferredoxin subunit
MSPTPDAAGARQRQPPTARGDAVSDASPDVRVTPDHARHAEGAGLRFEIVLDGVREPAFAVRWKGAWHAYLNRCRHESRLLDFGDAHFFDDAFDALVCCHHGARYRPDTGACLEGPCAGGGLTRLALELRGRELWCTGRARRP